MKDLIYNAVRNRSDQSYNAATHLSGGLDSGIVAAIAREQYIHQDKFIGFSWSPDKHLEESHQFDERTLVVDQSRLNDITPVFTDIHKADYLKYANNRLTYSESYEENKVLIWAKGKNINLIFSGYGGDEFISKGDRGIDTDLLINLQLKSFFRRNKPLKIKSLARRLIYEIIMPFIGLLPSPIERAIKSDTKYLKKGFNKPHLNSIRKFYLYKSRRELQLGFLYCYYIPSRTEDWYINGYRNGIEYRYPLLDKEIIEYILSVPSKFLIKDEYSRSIVRELSEGILPDGVRWKKSGTDPVAYNSAIKIVLDCAIEFSSEIDAFKKNPELVFIDFKKLENDLDLFRQKPDRKLHEDLLITIFNIKQIHEFVCAYRRRPYI